MNWIWNALGTAASTTASALTYPLRHPITTVSTLASTVGTVANAVIHPINTAKGLLGRGEDPVPPVGDPDDVHGPLPENLELDIQPVAPEIDFAVKKVYVKRTIYALDESGHPVPVVIYDLVQQKDQAAAHLVFEKLQNAHRAAHPGEPDIQSVKIDHFIPNPDGLGLGVRVKTDAGDVDLLTEDADHLRDYAKNSSATLYLPKYVPHALGDASRSLMAPSERAQKMLKTADEFSKHSSIKSRVKQKTQEDKDYWEAQLRQLQAFRAALKTHLDTQLAAKNVEMSAAAQKQPLQAEIYALEKLRDQVESWGFQLYFSLLEGPVDLTPLSPNDQVKIVEERAKLVQEIIQSQKGPPSEGMLGNAGLSHENELTSVEIQYSYDVALSSCARNTEELIKWSQSCGRALSGDAANGEWGYANAVQQGNPALRAAEFLGHPRIASSLAALPAREKADYETAVQNAFAQPVFADWD